MVAGVDGCKGGWVVALWGRGVELILCADFVEVVEVTRDCSAVAVDMPIGLALPGQNAPRQVTLANFLQFHACLCQTPNAEPPVK